MKRTQRLYLMAVAAAAAGVAVVVSARGVPRPGTFVLFAALAIGSELISVHLPNDVSASALLIPLMAAVYALGGGAPHLAGGLVAGFAGLYLPDLRRRRFDRVVFNSAQLLLSGCAAAAVSVALAPAARAGTAPVLLAALPAGLTFLVVNVTLLVPMLVLANDRPAREFLAELNPLHVQYIPFGLIGTALGLMYVVMGPVVIPLAVAPIVIARQTFASYLALKAAHESTLGTLVRALERKDPYTAGHVERVARYATYIGEELGLPEARMERLRYAALLHDVGKLVVANRILNKPGRLTAEEYERVRVHELVSEEILRRIEFLRPVAASANPRYARYEHATEGAPIEPYIIVVADAYDAMTSTRPYRRALAHDVAIRELRVHAGTQFHPACVEALVRALGRRGECHGSGHEPDVQVFPVPPPFLGPGSAALGDLAPAGPELRLP